MLCFKTGFSLFVLSKYYQILWKHLFWIGYSDVLSKLVTAFYPLCFKKQTLQRLELLPSFSFKVQLPTSGL